MAQMQVIYEEGMADNRAPGSFHVELRRWECGKANRTVIDYIYAVEYVDANIVPVRKGSEINNLLGDILGSEYKLEQEVMAIQANSDGEAIRMAAKRYDDILARCQKIKEIWKAEQDEAKGLKPV